jgi:hypothetical protein
MKNSRSTNLSERALMVAGGILVVAIGAAVYTTAAPSGLRVSTTTTATASPAVPTPAPTATPDTRAADTSAGAQKAAETVRKLYSAYAKTQTVETRRPYLTNAYAAELAAGQYFYDPVLCTQGDVSAPTYDQPVAAGKNYTVRVHTYYETSGDNPIDVTVDGSSFLVSKITCNFKQ